MSKPKPPRRKSSANRGYILWVVVVAVMVLVVGSMVPTVLFTSAQTPRTGSIDVGSDSTAVIGIDEGSAQVKNTTRLVTVTNRFTESGAAMVTARLQSPSASIATLQIQRNGGTVSGDSITISMSAGEIEDVQVQTEKKACDTTDKIVFEVVAVDAGSSGSVVRSIPIDCNPGGGGGSGGDITPPNASIDSITKAQKNNGRYNLDVSWSASDNVDLKGGTDEVQLYDSTGALVDTVGENLAGTTDSGVVTFKNLQNDPSGGTVTFVVTDSAGNTVSVTESVP